MSAWLQFFILGFVLIGLIVAVIGWVIKNYPSETIRSIVKRLRGKEEWWQDRHRRYENEAAKIRALKKLKTKAKKG